MYDEDPDDVVCPPSTDGYAVFLPYPYDCNLYYECDGPNAYLMSCPSHLHFDASLNVCNWPSQAQCTPKPRPEPEETPWGEEEQG